MSMNVNAGAPRIAATTTEQATTVEAPPTLETAQQGDGADAPRGGSKVKAFFKAVGNFFSGIGSAISTGLSKAADAIKTAFAKLSDPNYEAKQALADAFEPELAGLESEHNPLGTFLRGNGDVSRGLRELGGDQARYAPAVMSSYEGMKDQVLGVVPEDTTEGGESKLNSFGKVRPELMTLEDFGRVFDAAGAMMDDLFDPDATNPKSLMSQMPDVYKEVLSDMSEKILEKDNLTPAEKREALHTLYNDVVLRKAIPALMVGASKLDKGPEQRSMMLVAATIQAVANDVEAIKWVKEGDSGRPDAAPLYTAMYETQHPKIDAFFQAMGMPTVPDVE